MKNAFFSIIAIATIAMAVSCRKDNGINEELGSRFEPYVINAVTETVGNKAAVSFTYNLLWQDSDRIYVKDAGGSNDTFKLNEGAGTKEGTFIQEGGASLTGTVEAFYPTTLLENGALVWPAVQTADQKVPLYSTNTFGDSGEQTFRFSCLGAVLQIVFRTTVDNVKLTSIEIRDGEKPLSGAFSVNNGQAVITDKDNAGVTLNLGEGVDLGTAANFFNIVVPAGDYQNLTLIFNASNGKKCIMTGGKASLALNDVAKLTLTGTKFIYYTLPGEFSVSEGKKVRFTGGNLYWNGSAFKTEANQYDYLGEFDYDHVRYFLWNKDAEASITEFKIDGRLFTNTEETTPNPELKVGIEKGVYRVLSAYEWRYLLGIDSDRDFRTNAASLRKCRVTVCEKPNCFIIAPDVCLNGYVFDNTKTSYNASEWAIAEQAGLVCLPPAGQYRLLIDKSSKESYWGVDYVGSCYYWSSSYETGILHPLSIYYDQWSGDVLTVPGQSFGDEDSILGCSIRLVKDVQQ